MGERPIAWPTDPASRTVELYDILDDLLGSDDTGSIEEVAINLTASLSLIELTVFAAVARCVLENPNHRPTISIDYISPAGTDGRSAATAVQSTDDMRLYDRDYNSRALTAYLTHEFKTRLNRIRTGCDEARQELPADVPADGTISAALDELEAAIEMLGKEIVLPQIHALEEALWELADQLDDIELSAHEGVHFPSQ